MVTLIPTEFALHEAMRNLAFSTILTLCEQHQLGPADLEQMAHQLAQREAAADQLTTGEQHASLTRD